MGPLDRLKALAAMPDELAEEFADGASATLTTRKLLRLCTEAAKNDRIKDALGKHLATDSRKLQFGCINVPKAALGLPELLAAEIKAMGHPCLLADAGDHAHVYYFCHGTAPKTLYLKMANRVGASTIPFTIGGATAMLSPEAWAILVGIGFHVFGDRRVEGGNGAKTKRPGTRDLRKLRRQWAEAVATMKQGPAYQPPHGFTDELAVSGQPSSTVLAELKAYTAAAVGERFWDGNGTGARNMLSVLDYCRTAKRKRTHAESLKGRKDGSAALRA
jgi:hypothetical protein